MNNNDKTFGVIFILTLGICAALGSHFYHCVKHHHGYHLTHTQWDKEYQQLKNKAFELEETQ